MKCVKIVAEGGVPPTPPPPAPPLLPIAMVGGAVAGILAIAYARRHK